MSRNLRDGTDATTPSVSVAVSTYQRRRLLPRLVEALERQTVGTDSFEVVIADNGSTDGTHDELEALARASSLRLRIVRVDTNRGPAAGRNAAWRAASAPVIAFTDDDCVPRPEWIENGVRAVSGGGVAVGRTVPAPDQLPSRGPFSRTLVVSDATFFQTANVFYERADLEAVGGFDEGFPTPGGEDTDLGWRVQELGRPVAFAEDAIVEHDVSPSIFRAKVRETLRWWAIPRVIALHPENGRRILYKRVFWKKSHPFVIAALVGLAIAWRFPFALLLGLPWVWLRVREAPLIGGRVRRFLVLPGAFVIDALEVVVMVRGSVRFRVFVL